MDPTPEIKKEEELHDVEVTKEQFKTLYFQYATPDSGWGEANWHSTFEKQEGEKYFFMKSANPEAVMCISTGQKENRIYFLTEDALDSFYDFPGKDD
ncbi:MAG: hypothetical protein WC843_06520 [Candidatus Gracilibacteria bacterium]|jgi:hypothetical protein